MVYQVVYEADQLWSLLFACIRFFCFPLENITVREKVYYEKLFFNLNCLGSSHSNVCFGILKLYFQALCAHFRYLFTFSILEQTLCYQLGNKLDAAFFCCSTDKKSQNNPLFEISRPVEIFFAIGFGEITSN